MLRSLIVEDDFLSRKVLMAMLAPLGSCDVAVSGREALDAFQEAVRQGAAYDLICLDIHIPGMDGHQILSSIRSVEEIQGLERTRVLMTTASSDPRDVRAAFRSQCDGYLIKPITQKNLMKNLEEMDLSRK
jgi:two-component system chemotaxis response regulator CheY